LVRSEQTIHLGKDLMTLSRWHPLECPGCLNLEEYGCSRTQRREQELQELKPIASRNSPRSTSEKAPVQHMPQS
jgi:hypothetical protein